MKSEEEYYELEKRYLKSIHDHEAKYSEFIETIQSLHSNYEETLSELNSTRNIFCDLKLNYDNLNFFYDELKKDLTNPRFVLPKLEMSDIENYLRKKKLENLKNEKT